jgi:hypothetical protein
MAASQVQPQQQISIPPEFITGGGWVVGIGTLLYTLCKSYIDNINKRSQIDRNNASASSQAVIQQQSDFVSDMREEHKRVLLALEHNTEAMQKFTLALKRIEIVLEKFAS